MRGSVALLLPLLMLFMLPAALAQQSPPALERTVTERPLEVTVDRRQCGREGIFVQVLGASGGELDDGQASSGYLVWVNGRARILIDAGPGTALRFEESGADFRDLYAMVFTQVHPQHTADLPAFVMGSIHAGRSVTLPIFGPAGNDRVPGFEAWLDLIMGPTGAFRNLADIFSSLSQAGYRIQPTEIDSSGRGTWSGFRRDGIILRSVGTDHGNQPALAWRVDVDGIGITFTGSTANRRQLVNDLAADSVILVAHHAIPENTRGFLREQFMTPSQIGRLAADAGVNRLVLSHRSARTRGRETQSRDEIRNHYRGSIVFANDLNCWRT